MPSSQSGFTLVELVLVIIILGILSYSAVGLFATTSNFSAPAVRNEIIAGLRLGQHYALSQSGNNIRVVITNSGNHWSLDIRDDSSSISELTINKDNAVLRFSNTTFSGNCASFSTVFPITIFFDGMGNLTQIQDGDDASPINLSGNLRGCVENNSDLNFCIAPSGYSYEGNCEA